ncbi:serine-type endopeptidase [Aureococcus anophagefferens]|nr:serine-type endopeptidase [Aureococcus anophagefferens]
MIKYIIGYTGPGYIAQNIKDAIDYYNAKSGIVVFAAGNSNSEADYYPAFAIPHSGLRASFSNYGDWIEISAPGVSVYSTMLGTSYGYASGTSMACPHIAGVLALGKAVAPSMPNSDLLGCMYSSAEDVDGSNGAYAGKLGAGLVDAPAFLAPPVGDVEPVKDLKVKMHRKVGRFGVAAWRYLTPEATFVVEFQTNVDATWVRVDESRLYHDETDGMFYQTLHLPDCGIKGIARVTAVVGGVASEPMYSNIFKMKC